MYKSKNYFNVFWFTDTFLHDNSIVKGAETSNLRTVIEA